MNAITPHLRRALQAWLYAATDLSGYNDTHDAGLCHWTMYHFGDSAFTELKFTLNTEFGAAALYPFGGPEVYYREAAAASCHLNADRLAWVRRVLAR